MLEKFNEQQIELIKNCAEIVHSIEVGTVNQKNINALFETSYFFADSEYDWEENLRDANYAKAEMNERGNYIELVSIISEKFPEIDKAYLPFMIGDVLREAYNNEVRDNV